MKTKATSKRQGALNTVSFMTLLKILRIVILHAHSRIDGGPRKLRQKEDN